jgi:hypothetical protein
MGKEQLTIEVDQALMQRLRDAGVDPQTYVQQVLQRRAAASEQPDDRANRERALRMEMHAGQELYDRLVEETGDWSSGLRAF